MFNRFDILEAHYLFAALYHNGQGSKGYSTLSRIVVTGFVPRHNLTPDTLTDNGQDIYANLVSDYNERQERADDMAYTYDDSPDDKSFAQRNTVAYDDAPEGAFDGNDELLGFFVRC